MLTKAGRKVNWPADACPVGPPSPESMWPRLGPVTVTQITRRFPTPATRTLLRFPPAALLLQPGSEVRLLLLFQVHAVADELQRLLQCALRRRNGVLAEKVLHLLLVSGVAEAARSIHHRPRGKVGQLGFHLAPVLAYPIPGLVLGIGIAHEPPDKEGRVLRAHLGRDGVLQAALDQSRFLEVTQRPQETKGFLGRP